MTERSLKFESLEEVVLEAEQLLDSGYTQAGNWTLGQACHHLRLTIECNMNGYPTWMVVLGYPLRPFLRWLALPKLLAGRSPKGVPTAPMFVPAGDLDDASEVFQLKECISTFLQSTEPLHAHPGFGKMTRDEFAAFHAAHAAHHLNFIQPRSQAN